MKLEHASRSRNSIVEKCWPGSRPLGLVVELSCTDSIVGEYWFMILLLLMIFGFEETSE